MKKFVIILFLFPDLLFGQSRLAPNSAGGESKTLAQSSGNRAAPPPAADAGGVINALNFPGAEMGEKIVAALAAALSRRVLSTALQVKKEIFDE